MTPAAYARRVLSLLTTRERARFFLLVPLLVASSAMETASVAALAPFLALLGDPGGAATNPVLRWLREILEPVSSETFLFEVGAGVFVVILLGNVAAATNLWAVSRYTWMRAHSLATRLLSAHAARPYSAFLTANSAETSRLVLAESQNAATMIVGQSVYLLSRAIAAAFLVAALVAIDPMMAVGTLFVLGAIYAAVFLAARNRITRLATRRIEADKQRHRVAAEMIAGIKQVKLGGLEGAFIKRFRDPSARYARTQIEQYVVAWVPKYVIETIGFAGVLVTMVLIVGRGGATTQVLPLIGVFAFAAYRLLPAMQGVFSAVMTLRGAMPMLATITEILHGAPTGTNVESGRVSFDRGVALRRVAFKYPTGERIALADVELEIARGEWLALIGPTGAGKSTLVDLVLALLTPSEGRLEVDGVPITPDLVRSWQDGLGYVPQDIFLADDTVLRNICFGLRDEEIDRVRAEHAARIAQVHDFITTKLADGYDTTVGDRGVRLSGGERQRIGIARAIYRRPHLLVLDEATSALDGATEEAFFTALRASVPKTTVVSIAHRLTTTRGFDRIVAVAAGRIDESGTFEEMLANSKYFEQLRNERARTQQTDASTALGAPAT
jgi:ATP-binding cassette, subfamily B, bacterial PglK